MERSKIEHPNIILHAEGNILLVTLKNNEIETITFNASPETKSKESIYVLTNALIFRIYTNNNKSRQRLIQCLKCRIFSYYKKEEWITRYL